MTANGTARAFFLVVLFSTALRSLAATPPSDGEKPPRNFVVILADDLGLEDVGFAGGTVATPNIDRLASDGMIFSNGYSAGPVCSPTRASFQTGRSPARLGMTGIVYPPDFGKPFGIRTDAPPYLKLAHPVTHQSLPAGETTLAEVLRKAGYVTGHVGKWHLGPFRDPKFPDNRPSDNGFDFQTGWGGAGSSFFPPWNVADLKPADAGQYLTDAVTDAAIGFLEKNRDRPFFLELWHYGVHEPWACKKDDLSPGEGTGHSHPVYVGMIKSVDESVGKIRAALDRLGIAANTCIVFASDNGPVLFAPGAEKTSQIRQGEKVTSLQSLRGHKGSLYEGGIHVPTAWLVPGMTKAGSVNPVPVSSYDLFPTVLALSGVEIPAGVKLDGKSLVPELKGGGDPNRSLFWHRPDYLNVWRPDIDRVGIVETPRAAIRKGSYKLHLLFEDGSVELYDLDKDPRETTNIAASEPEVVATLRLELESFLKEANAQMPVPNPNYHKPATGPSPVPPARSEPET